MDELSLIGIIPLLVVNLFDRLFGIIFTVINL